MSNKNVFPTTSKTNKTKQNKTAHPEFKKEVNQGLDTSLALKKRDQIPGRDNVIN